MCILYILVLNSTISHSIIFGAFSYLKHFSKILYYRCIIWYKIIISIICTFISASDLSLLVSEETIALPSKGTSTYPQVWSLVDTPKSTYIPSRSPSHIPRSLFPRKGLDASLSSNVITSAPVTPQWRVLTWLMLRGLKRHDQFVALYFYCKIISYNYCSVLTANKCFIETELTS